MYPLKRNPPSPSQEPTEHDDDARAGLRTAIADARARLPDLPADDQAVLDLPEFHAPSGPVQLSTCSNPRLMRSVAGKIWRSGRRPPRTRPRNFDTVDLHAAGAQDQLELDAWMAKWPHDANPQTIAEVREITADLHPPPHMFDAIVAAAAERYPAADADWARLIAEKQAAAFDGRKASSG